MKQIAPTPLSKAPILKNVRALFFDIDDTFSSEGKILPEAYSALWRLHHAGIKTIPVTGRPAGWCDMIARMWPVTAVVGENGAFYSFMDGKLKKTYLESPAVRMRNMKKLEGLRKALPKKFKGMKFASDQAFREFDLAIDFCEDVKPWPEARVKLLLEFCKQRGAMAKLSSIHVNTWFGRYDKLTCVRKLARELLKFPADFQNVMYIGDSPNDEPFFENLPLTTGVANIAKYLNRPDLMRYAPKYITQSPGGEGFAELVDKILK